MPVVFMTEAQRVRNKAVKVLRSVRNSRQVDVAESYSDRAMKFFKERGELGMYKDLQIARIEMYGRLDKPRYTLKDGEWVRKWSKEQCGAALEAGAGRNHYEMAQAMGAGGRLFGGGNPYVGGGV